MARIRVFDGSGPKQVDFGKPVWLCQCGLSKNFPLCDGSHKKVVDEQEGKMYRYDGDERVMIDE